MTNEKNDLKARLASVLGKQRPKTPDAPSPAPSAPPQAAAPPQQAPQRVARQQPPQPPAQVADGTNPTDVDAIDGLLDRLNNLSDPQGNPAPPQDAAIQSAAPSQNPAAPQQPRRRRRPGESPAAKPEAVVEEFIPTEPTTINEAKLNDSLVAELALKYINAKGEASGQDLSLIHI